MRELLAALPIVAPVLVAAAVFAAKGRRAEGRERRKYFVGALMLVVCGVGVSVVAASLIAAGPPK